MTENFSNKNLEILKSLVDPDDEYGIKYIELIEVAIKEQRISKRWKFDTARLKRYKEKRFAELGLEYIYSEVHHIIPTCCGGTDSPENLVYLYCTEERPEHVQAHEYLWRSKSLFQDFRDQLLSSFFKMTYSRKLSTRLTVKEAAKLREDYGKIKSKTLKGKYGRNKRANKIIYNGVEYPSSNSLTEVEINGGFHDRHTILDWAKYGLHGLSLASGEKFEKPPKKKPEFHHAIKVTYDGKIYNSAKELVGITLKDGTVLHNHTAVLKCAREKEHGLDLVDESKREIKRKKPIKPKPAPLTREQKAALSPKSIKISYNGKIYPSARSLEGIVVIDGKPRDKGTILKWARENKNGLSLA